MNEYGHVASRDSTEKRQRERLGAMLATVLSSNAFYQRKLDRVRFDPGRDPLETLPLTTRAEIEQDQRVHPPYGTNLTFTLERYTRLHQTSGSGGTPLRWLDTPETWEWWKGCWKTIYDAAGVTTADRIVFPFSFGPFVGFWSAFESAAARGNFVLAAGGMTTTARIQYTIDHRATIVCCTPTYALHMAEIATGERIDLRGSDVRGLIVAGELGGNIPETRAAIEEAWGARVFDHAGMTEIGAWGYEAIDAPGGLFVNETEFIAEVIDPASGVLLLDGRMGELVLTNLGRIGSPLIRYRTGDLVRLLRGGPDSSIENPKSKIQGRGSWCPGGVLARVDDMLIVRGNNVFPSAIEGILRSLPGVAEFRIAIGQQGALGELRIEIERRPDTAAVTLAGAADKALRDRLNFRPDVRVVEPGTLPRFEMKAKRVIK